LQHGGLLQRLLRVSLRRACPRIEQPAAGDIVRLMPHAAGGRERGHDGQQKSGSPHQTNPRHVVEIYRRLGGGMVNKT
jgi:hypothetical protein